MVFRQRIKQSLFDYTIPSERKGFKFSPTNRSTSKHVTSKQKENSIVFKSSFPRFEIYFFILEYTCNYSFILSLDSLDEQFWWKKINKCYQNRCHNHQFYRQGSPKLVIQQNSQQWGEHTGEMNSFRFSTRSCWLLLTPKCDRVCLRNSEMAKICGEDFHSFKARGAQNGHLTRNGTASWLKPKAAPPFS